MKAQILKEISPVENRPLELVYLPVPQPRSKEILVRISACGVCHTELDEIEGRLQPKLPMILGHEIIGKAEILGSRVTKFQVGDRVGIAWIYSACGKCHFCKEGNENLCYEFQGNGLQANGGYAEYTVVSEDFAYSIPDRFTDSQAAPLLCAGAIGFRDLRLSGIKPGQSLGLFGFGASAHIVIQLAKYWGCGIFVFTRSEEHRNLAKNWGAAGPGEQEVVPLKGSTS